MRRNRTSALLLAALAVAAVGCARAGVRSSSGSGLPALSADARLVPAGAEQLVLSGDSLYQVRDGVLVAVARPLPQAGSGIVGLGFAGSRGVLATSDGTGVTVFGSTDAGRTWHQTGRESLASLLPGGVSDLNVALAGRRVVVLAREATSSNFASAAVLASPDGKAWSARRAPTAGSLATAGGLVWLSGGPMGDQVYSSPDGVRWTRVLLPVKAASWTAGAAVAVSGGAVVPVTVHQSDGSSQAVLYRTADGGRTWFAAASVGVSATTESGTSLPVAVTTGGDWFVLAPAGSRVYHGKLSTSVPVRMLSPNGLPSGIQAVSFSFSSQGLALASTSSCPNGKTSCRSTEIALRTADGGQTWERVVVT